MDLPSPSDFQNSHSIGHETDEQRNHHPIDVHNQRTQMAAFYHEIQPELTRFNQTPDEKGSTSSSSSSQHSASPYIPTRQSTPFFIPEIGYNAHVYSQFSMDSSRPVNSSQFFTSELADAPIPSDFPFVNFKQISSEKTVSHEPRKAARKSSGQNKMPKTPFYVFLKEKKESLNDAEKILGDRAIHERYKAIWTEMTDEQRQPYIDQFNILTANKKRPYSMIRRHDKKKLRENEAAINQEMENYYTPSDIVLNWEHLTPTVRVFPHYS